MSITLLSLALAQAVPSVAPVRIVDQDRKVVCHEEPVTGSLIQKRTCMSAAQRRKQSDDSQSDMQRFMDQGLICPGCQGR